MPFDLQPVLKGELLELGPLRAADFDDLFAVAADPPGDEIEWVIAGDSIRVLPARRKTASRDPQERLRLFDLATLSEDFQHDRLYGSVRAVNPFR